MNTTTHFKFYFLTQLLTLSFASAQINEGLAHYSLDSADYGNFISLEVKSLATAQETLPLIETNYTAVPMMKTTLTVKKGHRKSEIAWANIENSKPKYLRRNDPLLSTSWALVENSADFSMAAIQFPAHLDTKNEYSVYLETANGDQFIQTISSSDKKGLISDWAFLRLNQFYNIKTGEHLTENTILSKIGFNVASKKMSTATDQHIEFIFSPYIEMATSLDSNTKPSKIMKDSIEYLATSAHQAELVLTSFDRFFEEASKAKNQKYAFDTISAGSKKIESELNKYGFSISPTDGLHGKLNPELSEVVSISDIMQLLMRKRLPYEAEPFASLHGRWSHQAQFLAAFNGMTYQERSVFTEYLTTTFAGTAALWHFWNVLFDSRDSHIYGNRYWRDAEKKYNETKKENKKNIPDSKLILKCERLFK